MKKIVFLAISCFSLCVSSCAFTENIYIDDNGSGNFSLDIDASSIMTLLPTDSTTAKKDIDSIVSFKQLFDSKKDSIAKLSKAEQEKLKRLENVNVKIKMSAAAKQFLFAIQTDFKDVSELQDMLLAINTMENFNKKELGSQSTIPKNAFGNNNSTLQYSFNKKRFIRKATVNNANFEKKEKDTSESSAMFYQASSYIIKYHFPKKVKKITNASALFSEDKKTITIEYPLKDYMENPEKLNFEVEFE